MKTFSRNLKQARGHAGFSTLEMLVVIAVSVIISAVAIPEYLAASRYLKIAGDLRDLNGTTAQAKMRAASGFTHARIYADLTNNTFQLQMWAKTGGGTGCWVADQDPTQTCVTYTGSVASGAVQPLGQGDSFGFGSLSAGPTPGQATISQAAACYPGSANTPDGGSTVAGTACIEFNSRGIPVDNTNAPVATGALYITNNNIVEGVTASATGSIQTWQCPHGQTTWMGQ